uniref:Polycomb protein VEFS-Box domain-containing protein n=1 Tax=Meloidogyne enterolobii TaxID=390850 RepID=A0A6V7Y0Q2_MELEN|nr:unnamed protein product [Meloidogyne enterolobii]
MVFVSSSSDSDCVSDSSSEAEFRPPTSRAINTVRRRISLRSSPRKCSSMKKSRISLRNQSQNSPLKRKQSSSPSKLIQKNSIKSKTPVKNLTKSPCIIKDEKKFNCTNSIKENTTKVRSNFLLTPKQEPINKSDEKSIQEANIPKIKESPLKVKKLSKRYLNEFENGHIEKAGHCKKRKLTYSKVSSLEFEHTKKRRSSAFNDIFTTESDKKISPLKEQRMAFSPLLNDYSNPFDEDGNDDEQQNLNRSKYKRRMRDLVDLYRFLNRPDNYGFCRRPVYRPFLLRNLFYMRKQQPCDLFIDNERSLMENSYEKHQLHLRTGSRASDKIPTTVKFTLIRNYNCFGHKTALVQCYHVTELNNKFSQLKRIPSANFEKAVNEKISSYIDIDMLEECQGGVLEDKNLRAEHFVVRVVFRLEDAEIGGRHLRKMASRQSGESSTKFLRKNSSNGTREVVMFGSVRLFSNTPEHGLRVLTGETSILLSTATELGLDDLSTKSSANHVARLIHLSRNRSSKGSIPFIRIIALNEEEEEAETEKAESEREKRETPIPSIGDSYAERRSVDRMVSGLLKMEMDVADSTTSLLTNEEGRKSTTSTKNRQLMQKGLLELPEKIILKFMLNSSDSSSLSSNSLISTTRSHQNTRSREIGTSGNCNNLRWNVPKMHFSDSSATEDQHGTENSSSDENSLIGPSTHNVDCSSDTTKIQTKDSTIQFALRVLSVYSPCFFCKAKLRLTNLWTLYKHFRFMHPRFTFTYEPRILVTNNLSLPGFSISLNTNFDALFELTSLQGKIKRGCSFKTNSVRKWSSNSRPVWLVTRELAKKIRVNDEFPIERFTAIAHAHCNEFEYLLSMGRYVFEVPTKIDQQWLIQSGSRKLEDITDLHPAERIMMQMWNAFLPGIHITMLARKMTYKAARVFVGYHWRQIEQLKLRTHFLLLLSTLLNVNVIDEEERYDLLMRLDPNYVLFDDSRHYVTQELTLLEKERRNNQRAGSIDDESEYYDSKEDVSKLKISKKESKANDKDKKCFSNYYITQQSLLPSFEFNSLMDLRNRYPFASGKRLGNIWKFIRPYDFKDFALQISTASIAKC